MTTTQIILSIISSSVLSALLTSIVNYKLTSVNYKNEYYKKLLDKRLLAYEELHDFLGQFRLHIRDEVENTTAAYAFVNGLESLERLSILLLIPMKHSIWLSDNLSIALTKLSVLLHNIENKAKKYENPDKVMIKIGSEYFDILRQQRKEIENIMKKDLLELHNIPSFFKQNLKLDKKKVNH